MACTDIYSVEVALRKRQHFHVRPNIICIVEWVELLVIMYLKPVRLSRTMYAGLILEAISSGCIGHELLSMDSLLVADQSSGYIA